jgi:hypothetical protein
MDNRYRLLEMGGLTPLYPTQPVDPYQPVYPDVMIDPYLPPGQYDGVYAPTGKSVWTENNNQEVGESFLGDTITILAGATEQFQLEPQTDLFRVDKIVISSAIAPNFFITDIKFGTHTIFAGSGEISAMAFAEDATSPLVGSYTLKTSQQFSMSVRNASGSDLPFNVTLKGRHLK